jgi:hypothetical protein
MATSFAALLFRPAEVSDRALSQGFAVALAGWDVPSPRLLIAPLPGIPGYAAAFYASGAGAGEDELEHAFDLFEDELPPALAVLDAALEGGAVEARVYAITSAEDVFHDDAWRFDARGFERRFVHEEDDVVEAGTETSEAAETAVVEAETPAGATEAEERRALEAAVRPLRGSTFLSKELGAPVLAALVGALYAVERRLEVRLVAAGAEAVAEETARLVRTLARAAGRGAFEAPTVAGVAPPASYQAFVQAYDWADPGDPQDHYRELSIGAITATLRFLRADELRRRDADPAWKQASGGRYPIARLLGSALGGGGPESTLALAADGERLVVLRPGRPPTEAGPTLGELLRYLALGWTRRTEAEEDMIGALMLRAKLRADRT